MLNSFLGIKMRKLLITLSSTLLLFMSGMVSAAQTGTFLSIEEIEISEFSYFDIASDLDIGKVDPNHLFDALVKTDLSKSDALFVSCTALPILSIINGLEKKIGKIVLSSNQTLIWDTLKQVGFKNKIVGYGELFNN